MRKLIIKVIAFLIMLVVLFYINLMVFRSDYPYLWFITLVGSVIGLILFPYNKYFNTNSKN